MPTANPCKSDRTARRRRFEAGLAAGAIALGFVVLALLSPGNLDELPRLCLWSHLSGQPCPACGTLHALSSAAHGDLGQAVTYNRNVLVLAPLLLFVFVQQIIILLRRPATVHEAGPSA